jgi:hypothetical protein
MANKDQKRNKKEVRKPKKAKVAAPAAISAFVVTSAKNGDGSKKR